MHKEKGRWYLLGVSVTDDKMLNDEPSLAWTSWVFRWKVTAEVKAV